MTGAVKSRTNFIKLAKLLFAFPNWGDDMNNNMSLIDAAVGALGATIDGIWDNDTAYIVGDLIVDPDTSVVYECLVAHTTPSTGTFADERTAHPTYWGSTVARPIFRGNWTTATAYHTNEFVIDGNRYGIVTRSYTSGATYDIDVAAGNIITLIDLTAYNSLPLPLVATNMIRVNAGATAYEFRTPAQVLSDIGGYSNLGGTITGDVTLNSTAAGTARDLRWTVGGLLRWVLSKTATAESGGNAGSGMTLSAYDDAGTIIGTVLTITRATLRLTFGGRATFITPTTADASATFPHGVAPSAPVNGDLWSTTAAFFGRINGTTYDFWTDLGVGAATAKATPVGADKLVVLDSAASFVKKLSTWAQLIAQINITSKATPIDADRVWQGDSTTSFSPVYSTWTQVKAFLKTYNDTLYSVLAHTHTFASLTSKPTTVAGYGITDVIFTKQYDSGQQTVTSGGLLTLAHGLGAQPKLYAGYLQCTTSNAGYAVGDEIMVNPALNTTDATVEAMNIIPDGTNLNVRFGNAGSAFKILNKNGAGFTDITNTSWKFVARAWA